jgi:hypothetical protein
VPYGGTTIPPSRGGVVFIILGMSAVIAVLIIVVLVLVLK